MKKKATTILIVGLLLIAFAGTAIAESQPPAPQVPVPNAPNQDFYQQMWNFCHGPNGMMNQYYGNGAAPQSYGMMGRMMRGMMGGNGFGGMMGW
jgi:hypothetical protein